MLLLSCPNGSRVVSLLVDSLVFLPGLQCVGLHVLGRGPFENKLELVLRLAVTITESTCNAM